MEYFTEEIDIEKARYIYSLSLPEFKAAIYDKDEVSDDNQKYTIATYYSNVKNWLEKMIDKNGIDNNKCYKKAKGSTIGREYVFQFGIQSLQHALRGFLATHYTDYDMRNCHPVLLLHLCKQSTLNKNDYSFISDYVSNRENILNTHSLTKRQICIMINLDKPSKQKNEWLNGFNSQLKIIKDHLINTECKDIPTTNINNPISSRVSKLLGKIENDIITEIMDKYDITNGIKMFDGFLSNKDIPVSELDAMTEKYGVVWVTKPHDMSIEIDDNIIIKETKAEKNKKKENEKLEKKRDKEREKELKKEEKADAKERANIEATLAKQGMVSEYDKLKIEMEERICVINSPLQFLRLYNTEYTSYNKQNFITLHENVMVKHTSTQGGKEVEDNIPFTALWCKDPTRRTYEKTGFYPYNKIQPKCPDDVLNQFTPFDRIEKTKDYTDDNKELGWEFINHRLKPIIMSLVEQNEEAYEFFIKCLATKIQYPEKLQNTISVFKGGQGGGRNSIAELMKIMLGDRYYLETPNMASIAGTFNSMFENKLFCFINEVKYTEFTIYASTIKTRSTDPELVVNKKGIPEYKTTNACQLMMGSNDQTPIHIDDSDRRYFINNYDEKTKFNTALWTGFHTDKLDEDIMNSVFHIFNTMDLTEFDTTKIPATRAKDHMKQNLVKPVYRILYNHLNTKFADTQNFKTLPRDKDSTYVIPSDLLSEVQEYLEKRGLNTFKYNSKTLKADLDNLGVVMNTSKPITINKKTIRCFVFVKADLWTTLKNKYFNTADDNEDVIVDDEEENENKCEIDDDIPDEPDF